MRIQDMSHFASRGAYRIPETVAYHPDPEVLGAFVSTMGNIAHAYNFLVDKGVPMEDARELIPLGAQHRISWKLNIGSLQHIMGKRGCVTGDTRIPLLDGRTRTMKELLDEYGTEQDFMVYSCDDNGKIVPGRARHNGVTQRDAELFEVILDNGESIRATPDHRFMMRDGSWRRADELVANDRLMPLYRRISDGKSVRAQDRIEGYEETYHPGENAWDFTHRLAAPPQLPNTSVIHHDNFNKRDNRPENLVWKDFQDHICLHAKLTKNLTSEEQSRRAKMASREVRVMAGKAAAAKGVLKVNGEKAAAANRGNKVRAAKISASLKKTLSTSEAKAERAARARAQWANPEIRARMMRGIKQAYDGDFERAVGGGVATVGKNHRVVEVRRLAMCEDVYDLSVDDHHNYATDAGVFIHNCWILQLGIWGPVITGMVEELATKVHPIFRELVTPPCIKGDTFKGCIYMEENRRRYTQDDKHAPCPLHVSHHHLPDKRSVAEHGHKSFDSTPVLPKPSDDIPMYKEMLERAEDYRVFWGRDPYSGKRLPVVK